MPWTAFGALLRKHRIAAGYSQERLASQARISIESVSTLERGTRRAPYRFTVDLLSAALGLNGEQRAEFEAAAETARARTGQARPSHARNMPARATSFVGRQEDIAAIGALMRKSRLVTVTGPGGVGKTRTVLEVVTRRSTDAETAWFVDLEPVTNGAFVPSTIASALGVDCSEDEWTLGSLAAALHQRRALIVLDNCEHLVADAALFVSSMLAACPNLAFLATSRERLAVGGESIYRLPALDLEGAAPALFAERAASAGASEPFSDRDNVIIRDICRRLDGIPLAIELAAARAATIGVKAISARLQEGLGLGAGTRDSPVRQRTMAATIAWSRDLLSAPERLLFDRLCIIPGGFTLEAAEFVGSGDGVETTLVAELLVSLVEKSLVNADRSGETLRFTMLSSVRAFGSEQLTAVDQAELTRRHGQWLAAFADDVDKDRVNRPTSWLRAEVDPELANARHLLETLLGSGEPGDALLAARIVGGLRTIWLREATFGEISHWATLCLRHLNDDDHPKLVAGLLKALVQANQADPGPHELRLRRLQGLLENSGDWSGLASLHSYRSLEALNSGKVNEALSLSDLALRVCCERGLEATSTYATCLYSNAFIHAERACFDEARSAIADGQAVELSLGEQDSRFDELLAQLAYESDDLEGAVHLVTRFIDRTRNRPHLWSTSLLALILLKQGDVDGALAYMREAGDLSKPVHRKNHFSAFSAFAGIAFARGRPELAARLNAFALTRFPFVWRATARRLFIDQQRELWSLLEASLDDMDLARCYADGAGLTLDAAIAEAYSLD